MNQVALDLGVIKIYWYSIFIFLGMLVAFILIYREAKKRGIKEDFLVNLAFSAVIIGIIGARLYYVIFNLPYYLDRPLEILQIWNGGLAIHGGIIAGLIVVIVYCKKHNVNIWKVLDIIVVGLIIAQAIGRWGNFFNSEAYGPVTTANHLKSLGIPRFIIQGMYISGEYRQPTFFYESVWCVIGFLIMLLIRKSKHLKLGQLTGFYLIWYGIIRYFIESMRTDSLMLGSYKIAQIVSIVFIVCGLIIIIVNIIRKNVKQYNE